MTLSPHHPTMSGRASRSSRNTRALGFARAGRTACLAGRAGLVVAAGSARERASARKARDSRTAKRSITGAGAATRTTGRALFVATVAAFRQSLALLLLLFLLLGLNKRGLDRRQRRQTDQTCPAQCRAPGEQRSDPPRQSIKATPVQLGLTFCHSVRRHARTQCASFDVHNRTLGGPASSVKSGCMILGY